MLVRVCSKCNIEKSVDKFSPRSDGRNGGYQSQCRECTRKRYHEDEDYKKRRKKSALKSKKRATAMARELVRKSKNVPCVDCGVKYPYWVMDFDHLDANIKVNNIAAFVSSANGGAKFKKALIEEMSKCEVVCSNCHRERSHRRMLAKKMTDSS